MCKINIKLTVIFGVRIMIESLDFGLKDKVAIVAGGGAVGKDIGNGRAASILLAEAGAKVLVADKDDALAKNTVQMIKDRGGEAKVLEEI